jgi:hypothetical protein
MPAVIWELWRGRGRYVFARRDQELRYSTRSMRGMQIDAVVKVSGDPDVAVEKLKGTEPTGPNDLPDVGTLDEVLAARRARAAERKAVR